ncbi:RAQPRD family integrative conjugative element protein, partial [Pseudomonas syringae pv. tagetis]|uniref:RAQPRD family integrative conjugative element protein n=1 Tax=Pseudomonas syringae group genomosp. 7 TaxID=251699 RepID=UPI00376F63C7
RSAGTASELAYVEVMIRVLNALEAVALRCADVPSESALRYLLDFSRLVRDIARSRHGLQDYLAPSRAQAGDRVERSGQCYVSGGRRRW